MGEFQVHAWQDHSTTLKPYVVGSYAAFGKRPLGTSVSCTESFSSLVRLVRMHMVSGRLSCLRKEKLTLQQQSPSKGTPATSYLH